MRALVGFYARVVIRKHELHRARNEGAYRHCGERIDRSGRLNHSRDRPAPDGCHRVLDLGRAALNHIRSRSAAYKHDAMRAVANDD